MIHRLHPDPARADPPDAVLWDDCEGCEFHVQMLGLPPDVIDLLADNQRAHRTQAERRARSMNGTYLEGWADGRAER